MARQMPLFRCEAVVWKPEQMRIVPGKGFRRHHIFTQCARPAGEGGLCWQHAKQAATGIYIPRRSAQ